MSATSRSADTSDVSALRAYLLAHAIPGVDEVTRCEDGSSVHRRPVRWPGRDAWLDVTLPASGVGEPVVRVEGPADAVEPACAAARRWLGLDLDPRAATTVLEQDPLIGPLVRARPWLRVPGAADTFEGAVFVVLGQHVSVAAARAFAARLVAHHGAFPSAEALADLDPARLREVVGVTGARAVTIVALARAVADGILSLSAPSRSQEHLARSPSSRSQEHLARSAPRTTMTPRAAPDSASVREVLLALPGIGPWTADLVAMRCLRDPDVFLPGDLVLRKALGGVTAREAAALAEAWRPHRSTAVVHLWTRHALLRPT